MGFWYEIQNVNTSLWEPEDEDTKIEILLKFYGLGQFMCCFCCITEYLLLVPAAENKSLRALNEQEKMDKAVVRELMPCGFTFKCRTIGMVIKLYCNQDGTDCISLILQLLESTWTEMQFLISPKLIKLCVYVFYIKWYLYQAASCYSLCCHLN